MSEFIERNEFLSEGAADVTFVLESSGTVVTQDMTQPEAQFRCEAPTTYRVEDDWL